MAKYRKAEATLFTFLCNGLQRCEGVYLPNARIVESMFKERQRQRDGREAFV